jgi:protein phosphatase
MSNNFVFHSLSNIGLVRKANEDSYGDERSENGHVFVVCDGMGGHIGGAKASQLAVSSVLEYFRNHKDKSPTQLIHEAICFANTQVHGYADVNPEFKGMGTTCVVLLVSPDNKIYYGHVGDSRLYLYLNGELKRLTKDHSYVQFLVDTGQISEEEMETHPNKNQILKALGIDENVKPEVNQEAFIPKEGSLFMLCSDGLCGMVTDSAMKAILDGFSLNKTNKTAELLVDAALENGGKDNITVTLIYFDAADTTVLQGKTLIIGKKNTANAGFNKWLMLSIAVIALVLFAVMYIDFGNKKSVTKNTEEIIKEKNDSIAKADSSKNASVKESRDVQK